MSRKPDRAKIEWDDSGRRQLLAAARASVTKAFLTKEGGVRYGAAVLTTSGNIHSAGQYSSFNHSTNVHAEQAALVAAAMAGEPDVLALAVASTGTDPVTRPCGVCRQVMLEHAARIGRDFTVLMAAGESWQESKVSALLPHAWETASQKAVCANTSLARSSPFGGVRFQQDHLLQAGDHVRLRGGLLALVWDPMPWSDSILVKLKYHETSTGQWSKFPHAFSEPMDYERELCCLKGISLAPCGACAASVRADDIEEVFPMLAAPELPPIFTSCLRQAGIEPDTVMLSGSRSTGMSKTDSDLDLMIRADPIQATDLRKFIVTELAGGQLSIPKSSGTWRVLARLYPGGVESILANQAFAETFEEAGCCVSLMILPKEPAAPVYSENAQFNGLVSFSGTVVHSPQSIYKRARFALRCSFGETIEVISYHKGANLIRERDTVAVRGWLVENQGQKILLQFHPHRENIVWFPAA